MEFDGSLPVVLLPGFMLDATLWRDVQADLARIGPLVFGELTEGDSVAAMAQHVAQICPPRFVLLGFSLGGYVARELARLLPDRVVALVLVATSGRPDTPERARTKANAALLAPATNFRGMSRAALVASVHPGLAGDTELLDYIRAMGVRLGRDVFVRQSGLQRSDESGQTPIACPTLVIAAAQDQLRSLEEGQELADSIPGATLRVIDDAGHMLPLEQPKAMVDTIFAWLEKLD